MESRHRGGASVGRGGAVRLFCGHGSANPIRSRSLPMRIRRFGIGCLSLLAVLGSVSFVAASDPPVQVPAGLLDVESLAERIDQFLAHRLTEKEVVPALLSDDGEFIRRAYLDLAGCIPSIIDVRDFLDDTRPD